MGDKEKAEAAVLAEANKISENVQKDTACPEGYIPTGKKCPGTGTCCRASWTKSCGEGCAKAKCDAFKGEWIPLDYKTNPYTCETTGGDVKKVVEPADPCKKYQDEKKT